MLSAILLVPAAANAAKKPKSPPVENCHSVVFQGDYEVAHLDRKADPKNSYRQFVTVSSAPGGNPYTGVITMQYFQFDGQGNKRLLASYYNDHINIYGEPEQNGCQVDVEFSYGGNSISHIRGTNGTLVFTALLHFCLSERIH